MTISGDNGARTTYLWFHLGATERDTNTVRKSGRSSKEMAKTSSKKERNTREQTRTQKKNPDGGKMTTRRKTATKDQPGGKWTRHTYQNRVNTSQQVRGKCRLGAPGAYTGQPQCYGPERKNAMLVNTENPKAGKKQPKKHKRGSRIPGYQTRPKKEKKRKKKKEKKKNEKGKKIGPQSRRDSGKAERRPGKKKLSRLKQPWNSDE